MGVTRTRSGLVRGLSLWAPPLALMAVIFALSAQPDLSSGLGTADLILRKIAHMAEYGLLVFLWWRPLSTLASGRTAIAAAFAISLAYAATDEWHQSFVEGRHGTPVDVVIDAVGMSVVAWLLARRDERA
jgi:hypothetical protein